MDLQLQKKLIIVTGGAKGIGEGIVHALADEGAIPFVVGRNEADNKRIVDELTASGKEAAYFTAELSNPDECGKAVAAAVSRYGKIDGLVNNAGINDGVGLESGDYERFMKSLHSNLVH